MGYYWSPFRREIDDFFEYLFADKRTKQIIRLVPKTCRQCELLGMCRDEHSDWKCQHGCQIIHNKDSK